MLTVFIASDKDCSRCKAVLALLRQRCVEHLLRDISDPSSMIAASAARADYINDYMCSGELPLIVDDNAAVFEGDAAVRYVQQQTASAPDSDTDGDAGCECVNGQCNSNRCVSCAKNHDNV